jgi:acetoin:2,6-dichlorophenolindophenol oxidoreductase subunit alpha
VSHEEIARKKRFLQKMLLLRHFESEVKWLCLDRRLPGFCHIYVGEEAIAVGVCENLNQDDYITSSHRGHGHCLAKGSDPKKVMAELAGRIDGYGKGRGGSMHIFDKEMGVLGTNGIVGGGFGLAAGGGMHAKLSKKGQVCVCFFGDGAANQGTFHESINLAAVQHLPVIYICENNLYATATSVKEATLTKNFADRAIGYNIPGKIVDGNDVMEVYKVAAEAVARARAGDGPTLLECKTYRHSGHSVGEDGSSYRPKDEVDQWLKKDPIPRFKQYLLKEKLMDEAAIEQMEKEIKAEVKEAIDFAMASPEPKAEDLLRYVFVED